VLSREPATQRQLVEATYLDASDGPRVTYAPGPNATLEGERAALAAVYAVVVIQAHEQEKAAVSYEEDVEGR
jgi:hypothetical protein